MSFHSQHVREGNVQVYRPENLTRAKPTVKTVLQQKHTCLKQTEVLMLFKHIMD